MELESGCEISFKILFSNFEMKKIFGIIMTAVMLGSCNSNSVFVPEEVTDADLTQICRVEPLSWWVGMNTPLQLLIQGEGISEYDVVFEGGNGVKVSGVHKADSPNYLLSMLPYQLLRSRGHIISCSQKGRRVSNVPTKSGRGLRALRRGKVFRARI